MDVAAFVVEVRVLKAFRAAALILVVAGFFVVGKSAETATTASNPIVLENQQPGTTSWQFTNYNKESAHEIEGYASLTSVNKGDPINFMVSLSSSAQYTMDFYRMGWYPTGTNPDGTSCAPSCGGRLMLHVGPLNGVKQAACPRVTTSTDPNFGLTECQWTPSYTLTVPTTWTTGNYIVKLTRLDGTHLENWMTFVVRDDSSAAPIVYSLDVNTWQAYNFWGGAGNNNLGINLYGRFNDVTLANVSGSRAYTVSFDRPYLDQGALDGAGNFMVWDFPFVRWMESQGYDMTYVTDVDLESNADVLNGHRVFVNTGHDEYYSDGMRSRIEGGIASGVNAAFFGANNIYSRITWGSDAGGAPLRRVHTDKGALPGSTTLEFRNLTPPRPENAVTGVMQNGVASSRPFLVYDASSWIYAGTGLVNYTGNGTTGVITSGPGQNALPGLVGYEFDSRAVNDPALSSFASAEPAGLKQVGHSFVPSSDNGVNAWADATVYTAGSGATVFSAGTIQWAFGVDNGFNDGFCSCDHSVASSAGQKITANILTRFSAASAAPAVSLSPASLTFESQTTGTTSPAQSASLTNSGSAPLSISGIAVAGTNAGDYAQTNTCPLAPSTLAAGASCTISVTFTPSASGSRTASVTISDNASNSPQGISLTGTGTAPAAPAVTLTPAGLDLGQQLVSTTSNEQTATLTNSGSAPLSISGIAVAGTNASDYAQTNTCPLAPSTLAAGASCTISVTFTPTTTGTRTAAVRVTDDASGSPQEISLTGTGTSPAATVTLTSGTLAFGGQRVGTASGALSTTLTNSGNAPLTISSIAIAGADAADYSQSNTCPLAPSTLAAGAACTISVTFSPTATGSRSAHVSVVDDAADSPQTVALTGTGTAPAVSLTPPSLTFASQTVGTTSAAQTASLANTGTAPLAISSIAIAGTNGGDYAQTNACPLAPSTLAVGASCSISVTFSPGAPGSRVASLTVADDAAGSPHSIDLSGTAAAAAPAVALTPTSLTFGSQTSGTTSPAQSTMLTNSGNAPLTISGIGLAGTNPDDFAQTSTCPLSPSTLAAGAACTISVTFSPTASGSRSASLSVADDAAGSPQTVALSGTGALPAPAVALAPTSLSFGARLLGTTSAPQSTTLTNSGAGPLTISAIAIAGANPSDFAESSNCPTAPATLSPNASCTISVTFAPATGGSRTASVSITDNAPNSLQAVALSGVGIYLSDDFESGTLSKWSAAGTGTATVQTATHHLGSYAAALTATTKQTVTASQALAGGPQARTYTRFYYRYASLTAASVPIAYGTDANGTNVWEIDFQSNQKRLSVTVWNGAGKQTSFNTPNNSFPANSWNSVELRVDELQQGYAEIWINGASLGNRSPNLATTSPYGKLFLANLNGGGTGYYDDVVVASTYNGP